MTRAFKYAIRFTLVVVVAGLISVLLAPPSSTPGPYISALSDLAIREALAQTGCNQSFCPHLKPHKCAFTGTALNCTQITGQKCSTNRCV